MPAAIHRMPVPRRHALHDTRPTAAELRWLRALATPHTAAVARAALPSNYRVALAGKGLIAIRRGLPKLSLAGLAALQDCAPQAGADGGTPALE